MGPIRTPTLVSSESDLEDVKAMEEGPEIDRQVSFSEKLENVVPVTKPFSPDNLEENQAN